LELAQVIGWAGYDMRMRTQEVPHVDGKVEEHIAVWVHCTERALLELLGRNESN